MVRAGNVTKRNVKSSEQKSVEQIRVSGSRKANTYRKRCTCGRFEIISQTTHFHYYVNILPNIVFTSPQVLLDKLTELVKEAYNKRIKSTATTGRDQLSKGKWQKFQNNGIITLEFVEDFYKHYVKGLFSPPDLLKLFMRHLILTPFSPTNSEIDFTSRTAQYFMPSLLDMLPQDKLMEYRVVSVLASPLLIRFPNGWPRAGVFYCLQVYLIHQLGWKLLLIRGKPKLIAQNCVLLSPPDSSCRVTLIILFFDC